MQKLTANKRKSSAKIETKWFIIDATGVRLGKLSTAASNLLLGKNLVDSVDYQLSGQGVIIINADKVSYHPKREVNKFYARHSGYPGGFKQITLADQMTADSRKVIEHSIAGMLPKNKLRDQMLGKLKIYKDAAHEHEAQQPVNVTIN